MPRNANLQHTDMALNLVDLDRYPIADLSKDKGADFLKYCQNQMETNGWCNFANFIHAEALELLGSETKELLEVAETLTIKRTIYQGDVDPTAPDNNPRRQEYTHVARQVADDQIPKQTILKQLYHSNILTDFVRQV